MEPYSIPKCRDVKPWLIFGNFNKILSFSKKMGGRDRLEKQIEDFLEVLSNCELRENIERSA